MSTDSSDPPVSTSRSSPAAARRWLVAGACVVIVVVAMIGGAGWLLSALPFAGGGGGGPWGSPTAPEEGVADWPRARVDGYQQRLSTIAAWVRSAYPKPDIYPDLTLPPALTNSITHGPVEAIVGADGQVILMVQFYDCNLSSGSTGAVYATTPLRPEQLGKTPEGEPTIVVPYVWHNRLTRQVTANLYRAELDE